MVTRLRSERDVVSELATHCGHQRCCQCGAVRGTPEHEKECPDAVIQRMIKKSVEGYVPRKLPIKGKP
jgi:hypothetical protein